MTIDDIVTQRLLTQRLEGSSFKSPAEVVAFFGGVQSQDHLGAKWAVGQRIDGACDADVEAAFATGEILRVHMLRPTWHYVSPKDIRWIQELTGPRVMAMSAYYLRLRGLDDATLQKSYEAFAKILQGGKQLTRLELGVELKKAGVDPHASADAQRFSSILASAEHALVICSGAMRGKQHTYALLDERAPKQPHIPRDEALARLTQLFFASHGPATIADFAWWSSLTVPDIKTGLGLVGENLQHTTVNGTTYWFSETHKQALGSQAHLHLLPNYDEYTIAYKDRSAILPNEPIDSVHMLDARGNVIFNNVIVYGGRVIGTWRRTIKAKKVRIETKYFKPPTTVITKAFAHQAERYAAFIGLQKIIEANN